MCLFDKRVMVVDFGWGIAHYDFAITEQSPIFASVDKSISAIEYFAEIVYFRALRGNGISRHFPCARNARL